MINKIAVIVIISGANYSDFVTAYDAYFTAQILDTHRVKPHLFDKLI